jgi:ribonuclease D
LSTEHDLPGENLLTPGLVRGLAWSPPVPISPASVAETLAAAGARAWQIDLTADDLARALSGT